MHPVALERDKSDHLDDQNRVIRMRYVAKKLSASDLTLFSSHYTGKGSKQKAVNLDAAPLLHLFPDLKDETSLHIPVSLTIQGPTHSHPPHRTSQKIVKSHKNWRLNGKLVQDPDKRFASLRKGDLAIIGFDGTSRPGNVRMILVSQDDQGHKDIYHHLCHPASDARTMHTVAEDDVEFVTYFFGECPPPSTLTSEDGKHLDPSDILYMSESPEDLIVLPDVDVEPASAFEVFHIVPMEDQGTLPADPSASIAGNLEEIPTRDDRLLAQTLAEMIRMRGASVRLVNRSELNDVFSTTTVEQFLRDLPRLQSVMAAIPAFGRKTWTELVDLALGHSSHAHLTQEPVDRIEPDPVHQVTPETRAMTALEVVQHYGAGTRLTNCLARDAVAAAMTVGDYLDDPRSFRKRILDINALGRKTSRELLDLIERVASSLSPQETLSSESSGHPASEEWSEVPDAELRAWFMDRIQALSEPRRKVLERRYGFASEGGDPETLEEIATTFGVTRERVRQVERDGMKKLSIASVVSPLRRFIDTNADVSWDLLSDNNPLLPEKALSARSRRLDPLFRLAIDVVHGGLADWLCVYARKTYGAWMSPSLDHDEVSSLRRILPDVIRAHALPCPLDRLSNTLPGGPRNATSLEVALLLTDGISIIDHYVCQGTVGAVVRRTIALHRLCQGLDGAVFGIVEVSNAYRLDHPEDDVSLRVIRKSFTDNPHLFGCLYDDLWFSLPLGNRRRASMAPVPSSSILWSDDPGENPTSMEPWLRRLLTTNGPMRGSQIVEAAKAEPSRDWLLKGLVPIMLQSPSFERSAHGIFAVAGLAHDYSDYASAPPSIFLSETHAKHVAYAMHGETDWRLFPAWTDAYAYHLCAWARHSATPETFRSLLAVVDPAKWQISEEERASWFETKRLQGRWEIGLERKSRLGDAFPRPRDILPCLLLLKMNGSIGWLAAGRAAKIPFAHQTSADTLAFLVAIGAVTAPEHDWQLPHPATEHASGIVDSIQAEVLAGADPDWATGIFSELVSRASTFDPEGTWIGRDELAEMIDAPTRKRIGFDRSKNAGDLEEVLSSESWDALFSDG